MKVLVFNCGSSSIKYQLFDMPDGTILAKGMVQRIGESRSEAEQKARDAEIVIEEQVKDHAQGLRIIERMLTDPLPIARLKPQICQERCFGDDSSAVHSQERS